MRLSLAALALVLAASLPRPGDCQMGGALAHPVRDCLGGAPCSTSSSEQVRCTSRTRMEL